MENNPGSKDEDPNKPGRKKWPRLKDIFNKDLPQILKDTADDLKKDKKEVGALILSTVIPGGWIGYGAYRAEKYRRKKKAANDNPPPETPPVPQKKPPPQKPPKS